VRATLLAVDDDEDVRKLIELTLGKEHTVRLAEDAAGALKRAFEEPPPDLILLDVGMPDASGYEVCKTLKGSPAVADIPVVFLSVRAESRDVVQGFQLGALDYLFKPISPPVLAMRVRAYLELIERRNKQNELLRERGAQLEATRLELIRRLARVMEYHETSAIGNRVIRLGHYARVLGQACGARPIFCDLLMKAAPLHDIGKVGVPAAVLRKNSALTAPEREQMRRHPEIGAEIIGKHDDPLLELARTLALTHHERWEGSGYPSGVRGNDIPWPGRLMAIVDAFEAMTVTQFHREPWTPDLAADEIVRGAGRQFDPAMVAAFRKALPEFKRIHSTYADQLGDMLNLDFAAGSAKTVPAPVEERQTLEADAGEALRRLDAARAKALVEAQARLKIEHDLAAAAQKDIVTPHDPGKEAEPALRALLDEKAKLEQQVAAVAAEKATRSQAEVGDAQAAVDALRRTLEREQTLLSQDADATGSSGLAALLEEQSRLRHELDAVAAAQAEKNSAAEVELEDLRAALVRERALSDAARQQATAVTSDEATVEKRRLKDEIAQVVARREQALAQAAAAREAAENGAVAAVRSKRSESAAAEKATLEERRPPIIGPQPRPLQRRGAAFVGFLLGGAIASAAWYLVPQEKPASVQAKASPTPPPPAPPKPAVEEPPGEPLALRLDTDFAKLRANR